LRIINIKVLLEVGANVNKRNHYCTDYGIKHIILRILCIFNGAEYQKNLDILWRHKMAILILSSTNKFLKLNKKISTLLFKSIYISDKLK
jgi:hypothetical protein